MLNDTYTSTGSKFFAHQEAMYELRAGRGKPIVTHVMLTDVCNHKCAFCSVQHRAGDSLKFDSVLSYLIILKSHGLKAVILSGGGNPILYKCRATGKGFNEMVVAIYDLGLEIGLITNGMPLRTYSGVMYGRPRVSWTTVSPKTLDMLKWVRISMSGLDHDEDEVFVPDIDQAKTTLGFSYVAHDIYDAPEDKAHGKVSTEADVAALGQLEGRRVQRFNDRIPKLYKQLTRYCSINKPKYLRLLPNCLEPSLIESRCHQLGTIARCINLDLGAEVAFVQNKPPAAPKACYLGYVHPVLNSDGYVYPCDSCVLNEAAGHQFGHSWRVCHWSEVEKIYREPVRSLINDPAAQCPGCVFSNSNAVLGGVVDGTADMSPPSAVPEHVNFV
jgi:MoaA/NifB/PqqE/SkfB family radical SAM enzyme